jgi:hypothetical protein
MLATSARAQWGGGWDYGYPASWSPGVVAVNPMPAMPSGQTVVVILDSPPPVWTVARPQMSAMTRQALYLIAFKDSVVRAADQYWVTGNTLYYLTPDHRQNTAPLSAVNRTLSERLNSEQNVAFTLPAEKQVTVTRLTMVTHRASRMGSANRMKHCRCTLK